MKHVIEKAACQHENHQYNWQRPLKQTRDLLTGSSMLSKSRGDLQWCCRRCCCRLVVVDVVLLQFFPNVTNTWNMLGLVNNPLARGWVPGLSKLKSLNYFVRSLKDVSHNGVATCRIVRELEEKVRVRVSEYPFGAWLGPGSL